MELTLSHLSLPTRAVCHMLKIDTDDITKRSRNAELVAARDIICLLLKKYYNWSDEMIAEELNATRTAVTHARKRANIRLTVDEKFLKNYMHCDIAVKGGV